MLYQEQVKKWKEYDEKMVLEETRKPRVKPKTGMIPFFSCYLFVKCDIYICIRALLRLLS